MNLRIYILFISLLFCSEYGVTQPTNDGCSNATLLCSDESLSGTNISSTIDTCSGCEDDFNNCLSPHKSVWYSFKTNDNGGNATVNVNNINCLNQLNKGEELNAVIMEASTPCDPSTYNTISSCNEGGDSISISASGLASNTKYFIYISGVKGANNEAAECDFEVSVSGNAVDIITNPNITDQNCGGSNGEIVLNSTSGGTSPYKYSIDGGNSFQSNNTFSNLQANSYTVIIKDSNNCTDTITVKVEQIGGPSVSNISTTSASCNSSDGKIELTGINGGTTPYSFQLNDNSSQSDSSFSNVPAGVHQIIVSDAQGCEDTLNNISVNNANGITNATVSTNISECGKDNGTIEVTNITGGAASTYSIDGGTNTQTNNTFSNIPPGTYEVEITDTGGCKYTIFNVSVLEKPTKNGD
ncbi:MAG: hypothetical protein ABEH43_02290, partial [Flavobacteriales bacterium]